jgi:hypothetical protein
MCLIAYTKLQEAKDDIVCYKFLLYQRDVRFPLKDMHDNQFDIAVAVRMEDIEHFYTPVMESEVDNRCIYQGMPYIADECFFPIYDKLGGGFIHTYADKERASAIVEHFILDDRRPSETYGRLFKCIIPKGTLYALGKDEASGYDAYASYQIIFKEEVPVKVNFPPKEFKSLIH